MRPLSPRDRRALIILTAAAAVFAAVWFWPQPAADSAAKWDYMTFVGTLGLFTALFLLFVRFLPMIPMNEIRMMLPGAKITPKATAKAGD